MKRYNHGEFGKNHLTMAQILEAAHEKDLFDKMSILEFEYLINHTTGITKMMFIELESKKLTNDHKKHFVRELRKSNKNKRLN